MEGHIRGGDGAMVAEMHVRSRGDGSVVLRHVLGRKRLIQRLAGEVGRLRGRPPKKAHVDAHEVISSQSQIP